MEYSNYIEVKRNGNIIEGNTIEIDAYPSSADKTVSLEVWVDGSNLNNSFYFEILGNSFIDVKRDGNNVQIITTPNYDIYKQGKGFCIGCGKTYEGDVIIQKCTDCEGEVVYNDSNTHREALITFYSNINSRFKYDLHFRQRNMVYDIEPNVSGYSSVEVEPDINGEKDVNVYLLHSYPTKTVSGHKCHAKEILNMDVVIRGGKRETYISPPKKISFNQRKGKWEFVEYDKTMLMKYVNKDDDDSAHSTTFHYQLISYGRLHLDYEGKILYRITCSHLGDYKKTKQLYFRYEDMEGEPIYNQTYYICKYLESGSYKPLLNPYNGRGKENATITVTSETIVGYSIVGSSTITKTLSSNEEDNEFIFYYVKDGGDIQGVAYTIKHVDQETEKSIIADETGSDNVGKVITVNAKTVEGYNAIEPTTASLTLTDDANKNVHTFYYQSKSQEVYRDVYAYYYDGDDNGKRISSVTVGSYKVGDKCCHKNNIISIKYDGVYYVPKEGEGLDVQKCITVSEDRFLNHISFYFEQDNNRE